jgi:hypothetical protein
MEMFSGFNNPLSPPGIPPKFVLHRLSSKSKFLAVSITGTLARSFNRNSTRVWSLEDI